MWARFKQKEDLIVINGSNLSSSKYQMTVQIGLGLRANLRFILQTQIETPL